MKVAVIGSRGLTVMNDLGKYLPEGTTEIVSGGARGIDTCAKESRGYRTDSDPAARRGEPFGAFCRRSVFVKRTHSHRVRYYHISQHKSTNNIHIKPTKIHQNDRAISRLAIV